MPECSAQISGKNSPQPRGDRGVNAILWDFDGVIARTENLHVAAWQRVVRHVEVKLPRQAFDNAAIEDDRDLIAKAFASLKIKLHSSQIRDWCAAKQAILVELLKTAPPIYPQVAETMRWLASEGLRQAVVTSTWRANVEATLGGTGLLKQMDFIVAKEDVARPKPSPDGYRLAVQRLGLPPGQCLALEDSPAGLASARAAGVAVLAVAHPFSPAARRAGEWAGGATVIQGFSGIQGVLASIDR